MWEYFFVRAIIADKTSLIYPSNQELPTALLDLLEAACSDLFYSGCVIVEVRDLRRRPPLPSGSQSIALYDAAANSSFVLLRPTTQSLICDSNLLVARAAEQLQKVLIEEKTLNPQSVGSSKNGCDLICFHFSSLQHNSTEIINHFDRRSRTLPRTGWHSSHS